MPRHRAVAQEGDEADMPDQVIGAIRFGMESIKHLCKDMVSHCDAEMKNEVIDRLGARYQQLIKAELIYDESSRIVNRAVEEMPNDENSDDQAILKSCENIADVSLEGVKAFELQLTEATIKNSRQFREFNEAVQAALSDVQEEEETQQGTTSFDIQPDEYETDVDEDDEDNDEDDDEESTAEVIPTTDPITKKPLKDPVRNKYCQHIYGKKGIMGLLKTNSKIRCPTIGCTNKKLIKEAHLVVDEKLENDVRKLQGRKRRGKW